MRGLCLWCRSCGTLWTGPETGVYASRAGTPRRVWSEVVSEGRVETQVALADARSEQWKELPGSVCFYLGAESAADGLWGRRGPPGVWLVLLVLGGVLFTLREAGRGQWEEAFKAMSLA